MNCGKDENPIYQCLILKTKDNQGKFDSKSGNGILLGYSETSKAYRVCSFRTLVVEEAIHVRFNDTTPDKELSDLDKSFANLRQEDGIKNFVSSNHNTKTIGFNPPLDIPQEEIRKLTRRNMRKNNLESQIISDPTKRVQTRAFLRLQGHTLISEVEPKHID